MQFQKKQIGIGLFLVGILVFLFTPLGFMVRVQMSKLLSSSAAIIKTEMQTPLDTYQWLLVDQAGNDFNFERKRGEVILINFWATWCPPCVAEMPSLQKLYDDYGDRVAFMFVAKDNSKRVTDFLIKKGYTIPVYYTKTKNPDVLTSKALPTTYIISREGRIIVAEIGATDWNSQKIRSLLEELLKE
ncbi:MAG: TlpA disulfide reductase family protein [Flavobacteriaceae bacterium]